MIKLTNQDCNNIFIELTLTNKCNFNCSYCCKESFQEIDDYNCFLNYVNVLKIFENRYLNFEIPQIKLVLSGGEPSLFKYLNSLYEYAINLRCIKDITIFTNGVKQINLNSNLISNLNTNFNVSLHKQYKKFHEKIINNYINKKTTFFAVTENNDDLCYYKNIQEKYNIDIHYQILDDIELMVDSRYKDVKDNTMYCDDKLVKFFDIAYILNKFKKVICYNNYYVILPNNEVRFDCSKKCDLNVNNLNIKKMLCDTPNCHMNSLSIKKMYLLD